MFYTINTIVSIFALLGLHMLSRNILIYICGEWAGNTRAWKMKAAATVALMLCMYAACIMLIVNGFHLAYILDKTI